MLIEEPGSLLKHLFTWDPSDMQTDISCYMCVCVDAMFCWGCLASLREGLWLYLRTVCIGFMFGYQGRCGPCLLKMELWLNRMGEFLRNVWCLMYGAPELLLPPALPFVLCAYQNLSIIVEMTLTKCVQTEASGICWWRYYVQFSQR